MTSHNDRDLREGAAIWSLGFRPFFLASALWAAAAVPIWMAAYGLGEGTVGGQDGRRWHVHEMLFGYVAGVIAGFLLTALPNWTGRPPWKGRKLIALFALWAVGRIVGILPNIPVLVAAVVDSAFLIVIAGIVWREVLTAASHRNLPVCLIVTLLALANVVFHLSGAMPALEAVTQRATIAAIIMLIALIGGRVVPSFTQSWLLRQGMARRDIWLPGLDRPVLILTTVALAAWIVWPSATTVGGLLTLTAIANLARLARWRGWEARTEALVWILHAGYAWLGLALALLGLSTINPILVPYSAGIHASTAGAMGVMTMAIMTRATLGHTGQPTTFDRWIQAIYGAILLAAAGRVLAPFVMAHAMMLLGVSAILWSGAFLGFALRFGSAMFRLK